MIGKSIKIFEVLDSTNDFIKLNLQNLEDGTVIVAKEQSSGRGLRGNTWQSEIGNLYFSYILKKNINRVELFKYIVKSSVAIIRTLSRFGIHAEIKYPNDCLIGQKKVCGILIESVGSKLLDYLIVGIGINVNQIDFSDLNDKGISMKNVLEKDFDIVEVLNEFIDNYNIIEKNSFNDVFDEYLKTSVVLGKKINLKDEEFKITDIDYNGTIVITNERTEKRIAFSEISLKELY